MEVSEATAQKETKVEAIMEAKPGNIYKRIEAAIAEEAVGAVVDTISIGLGYTAVTTSDGRCGVSFTYFTRKSDSCTVVKHPMDFEGAPAADMLPLLHSEKLIERAAGIALVNALNNRRSASMEEDSGTILEKLELKAGGRCAMVGFFGPVVSELKKAQVQLETIDESKGIGESERFYRFLKEEADALILTSTSLINGTAEGILAQLRPGARSIMLGPTTIMLPEVFIDLPVGFLGGISVSDTEGVLKAVRHGKGTHSINKFAKKVIARL